MKLRFQKEMVAKITQVRMTKKREAANAIVNAKISDFPDEHMVVGNSISDVYHLFVESVIKSWLKDSLIDITVFKEMGVEIGLSTDDINYMIVNTLVIYMPHLPECYQSKVILMPIVKAK